MSRAKAELPSANTLLSFLDEGGTQREAAEAFSVSLPTIRKRISELQVSAETLEIYRELQPLHITALQAEVLERITPDKISSADFDTLIKALSVLKKIEAQTEQTKQKDKITGLVAYLLELEKRDREGIDITPIDMVSDPILESAVEIIKEPLIDEDGEELLESLP